MAGFATCTEGDPKLWPLSIKLLILFNVSLCIFMGNMFSAGISTGFAAIAEEFHVSFLQCTALISWSVLALGLASIIFMPLALCIGKRPTILGTMFVFLAGGIWSTQATTFNGLLASRILAGVGGGAIETVGPSILADIFFEKYFATAMAVFTFMLSAGTQFGPLIAGYVIRDDGWRTFNVICVALIALNIVTALLFLPETSYRRAIYHGESAAEIDQQAQAVDFKEASAQHTEYVEGAELRHMPSLIPARSNATYAGSYVKDLFQFRNRSFDDRGIAAYPWRLINPLKFLLVPQVMYAAGAFGMIVGGVVLISALSPDLLTPPPYLFTSVELGVTGMASFVGVVLAYPFGGPATDYISRLIRNRRFDGRHQPEDRMPALILPLLICPSGLVIFGCMIDQHKPYVGAAVGYAMQAAGQVLVPSVVLSYVVDAYPQQGGEALVLVNAVKNLLAFAFTEASPNWLAKAGVKNLFLQFAGIQWGVLALGLPLWFAGPWLRKKMARYAY